MTNVLEYLEYSAQIRPCKVAAQDMNNKCTYSELMHHAKCIGSALAAICPVRSPVAVLMEKSVEALVSFIGIVYAGCFYVFINPELPSVRIKQILEITDTHYLITDNSERLKDFPYSGTVLEYTAAVQTAVNKERLFAIREQSLDIDPLYCNFTSGSTGVPKGVLVSHRSVIDFMNYFPDLFGITEKDVIGNQAPFDFDVSVKDIYSSLKVGATLVILPKKLFSIVTLLLDTLCDCKVTTLIWAVSALCLVAQFKGLTYRIPESVNKILFSGEMMPVKFLRLWQSYLPDAAYVNLYGPTEITCNCTYYRISRSFGLEDQIPIGRPFPNEKVFLLDEKNRLITNPDVSGELCVSGTALALGYFSSSEQTARVFVQNPLNTSYPEQICRTGDLAYYNADGDLCFAGRKDFQIKYRGHRIELEEIETVMNSLPDIHRACCGFDAAKNRIVAFYCGEMEPKQFKKSLYPLLPEYMIPAEFQKLKALPVSLNGKIDRKQLMSQKRCEK